METGNDLTVEELEHLVFMATCAPSVHNTQPWQFVEVPGGLSLQMDRSRQLDVLDPDHRALVVSCGAAVHHVVVAARALGFDAQVTIFPSDDHPDTVATVLMRRGPSATKAQILTAAAVSHRHTYRGRFTDEPLPLGILDRLRIAVEGQRAMLRIIGPDELVEVEVLVSRAEQALLQTYGYPAELARWVWRGEQPAERGDGMPHLAIDHGPGRAESLQGRQFEGVPLPRPEEPPAPEQLNVVLLSTQADTRVDWVEAGQALSALLLLATEEGVVAQPIGQVVDVPATRWSLQRHLGTVGAPQMLLRLGLGATLTASPRRPLGDVLHS